MINRRSVFKICIPLLLLSLIITASAFSQLPSADQSQIAQNNQTGQTTSGVKQSQQGPGGQMPQGPGGQQGFGGQGQQSGQMQTMIIQALKQKFGSSDEEWTIIGPKVLKVYTLLSSQSRGFQMRSLMGNSNQGNAQGRGGVNNQASSSGDKTLEELQTLLASQDTTTTQLKNKISEVRKEKEESKQKLAKAQKELRDLLTLKQEAILISVGMLE